MKPKTAKFILTKILGWSIAPGEDVHPSHSKAIILAAPHTSIWDFVNGFLYFRSIGIKPRVMIKKEAFVFPLSSILKSMGGFPIDRSNPQKMLMGVMHAMNESDNFFLCICPEGTRKPIRKWKTGYHSIASHTGVPVYIGHLDYKNKVLGMLMTPVELTDNAREDTNRIQQIYADMHLTGMHKDGYVTE